MKRKILSFLPAIVCLLFFFTSCKKQSDPSKTATTDAEIATHSDDENRVSTEIDAVVSDANTVIESNTSFSGNATVSEIVCDATVALDSVSNPMTMTITYNGSNCGGVRKRTGVVVVSIAKNARWKNAGTTLTVTYKELKVIRTRDNKSITLNGSHTITNVTGGLLTNLASLQSITHTISSDDMSITFDDGTKRTWHVAKQHAFTFDNGIVLTVSGMHSVGDSKNITEWGTNRFGNEFKTAFTGAVVIKQSCDFRITSGEVTHITPEFTAIVSFGLDITGVATSCPGTGHYYYKLGCTRIDGKHFEIILPY
jgi:hypothetical protein